MTRLTRRDFLHYSAAAGAALGTGGLAGRAFAQEKLKIGVVYVSPIAEIGWTKQHSLGVDAIKAALGDKVEITVLDNIFMPQDAERVFRELAAAGNKLIFGTSFSHGTPITCASATPAIVCRNSSTSRGYTFSPPRMITSLIRPTIRT